MTDQIPADKVRKIASEMRAAMRRVEDAYPDGEFLMDMSDYIRDIDKLCARAHPRPRPTLADMTDEEREACRWMQCDVRNAVVTHGVLAKNHGGDAHVLDAEGEVWFLSPTDVTPRPDLPRLEWPGDQEPTPAPAPALPDGWRLADHKDHGRVLVVRTDGENAIFATPYKATGIRTHACMASDLTFLDTDNDQKPEDAAPAKVGTVIESAGDPRIDALPVGSILLDLDEEATIKGCGDWTGEGYIPIPSEGAEFGPWTVLHIPKEADQ